MKDWALILGASSGIGAACAKRLAQKGINIYGLYPYTKHIQPKLRVYIDFLANAMQK